MALRVALVHDWLTNQGGGERVLWQLHQLYPNAPIYTSVYEPDKMPDFAGLDIRTSFLQNWPIAKKKHQLFPTLRTVAMESFDLSQYDLVISSSSAEAKGVITSPGTTHISYLHTPTRYYWSGYHDYLKHPGFGPLSPLIRLAMPGQVTKMREWDFAAAQRPDYLVANSQYVAARVKKYYRRNAEVIHPPVDVERFDYSKDRQDYFLVVSRLIPYKQVELAVRACTKLNQSLKVVGRGSELERLKKLAGPSVTFISSANDDQVAQLMAKASAFIFTAEEDFGITPVEAMASGCPVIAYGVGGATESVIEGTTGLFFKEPTVESVMDAIRRFEGMQLDVNVLRKRAEQFSNQRFAQEIKALVTRVLKKPA